MHLKTNTRAEFAQTIENEFLPVLRKQHGFRDEIVFVASGSAAETSPSVLGTRKRTRKAYHGGSYPKVLKALAKVVDGPARQVQ